MSKLIGVTPGPVKYEVMDEGDVKKLLTFGTTSFTYNDSESYTSTLNDYVKIAINGTLKDGDTILNGVVINLIVPFIHNLDESYPFYNTTFSDAENITVSNKTIYAQIMGNVAINMPEGEDDTTASILINGNVMFNNPSNTDISFVVDSVTFIAPLE